MQAVYYRAPDGTEPVLDYLRLLKGRRRPTIENQITRLNLCRVGEHLPIEYAKQVDGELRELRCHYGSELYRIYYRQSRHLFILLHVIRKGGAKLPERDTTIARQRWLDFRFRMDAQPRHTLRPAGRDAP